MLKWDDTTLYVKPPFVSTFSYLFGDGEPEWPKPGEILSFHQVLTFASGLLLDSDVGVPTSAPPSPTSTLRAVAASACNARNSSATAFLTGTSAAAVRPNKFPRPWPGVVRSSSPARPPLGVLGVDPPDDDAVINAHALAASSMASSAFLS